LSRITRCPNDREVLAEFTRARADGDAIAVEVCEISWPTPHTPELKWTEILRVRGEITEKEILKQRARLLQRRHFFKVCKTCGERKPVGWMHDQSMCQGCASQQLGVVY
jgi:hypothetical protein